MSAMYPRWSMSYATMQSCRLVADLAGGREQHRHDLEVTIPPDLAALPVRFAAGGSTSPTSAPRPPSTANSASAGRARNARSCWLWPRRKGDTSRTGSPCSATTPTAPPDSLRTRLMVFLAAHFGTVFVLALMQRAEGRSPYETDATPARQMAADERIHGEVLRGLAARGREQLSGSFRAAVFGANDGLVEPRTGARHRRHRCRTRTSYSPASPGLLAGALSMGAGEYVRCGRSESCSSRPRRIRSPVGAAPSGHGRERARAGLPGTGDGRTSGRGACRTVLATLDLDADAPDTAQVDPHEAIGSAWGAAISSFCFFASGASIPVLPYLFGATDWTAVIIAAALVGITLLGTGAVVGILSGASPLKRALRQLGIGYGAAAVTYLLGLAFSASTG